jgi:hypothetical protein
VTLQSTDSEGEVGEARRCKMKRQGRGRGDAEKRQRNLQIGGGNAEQRCREAEDTERMVRSRYREAENRNGNSRREDKKRYSGPLEVVAGITFCKSKQLGKPHRPSLRTESNKQKTTVFRGQTECWGCWGAKEANHSNAMLSALVFFDVTNATTIFLKQEQLRTRSCTQHHWVLRMHKSVTPLLVSLCRVLMELDRDIHTFMLARRKIGIPESTPLALSYQTERRWTS